MIQKIKQGTFRWRRRFRYMPNIEMLKKELPITWLVYRLYTIIWKHILNQRLSEIELIRIKHLEFVYIIHQDVYGVTIEIIQKEPKNDMELY